MISARPAGFRLAQRQRRAVGDLCGEQFLESFADLFRVALEDDVEVAAEPSDHRSDVAYRVRGHVVGDRLVDVDGHVLVSGHGDRIGWIHASSGVRSSVRSRLRRTSTSVTASVPAWRANVEDGRRTAPTSSAFLARSARMVSERLSSVYLLVSSMATPPGRSASTERSMK